MLVRFHPGYGYLNPAPASVLNPLCLNEEHVCSIGILITLTINENPQLVNTNLVVGTFKLDYASMS